MWTASLAPTDIESVIKMAVVIIGGLASLITAIGAAVAALRTALGRNKRPGKVSDIDEKVSSEVIQGLPISVEQMEFEDVVKTRKRLERAIALLAKHNIEYEEYLDGKELKP